MKLIRTNKDLIFWSFIAIWLITIDTLLLCGVSITNVQCFNLCMILFFGVVLVIPKCISKRFNNWLEKDINGNKAA